MTSTRKLRKKIAAWDRYNRKMERRVGLYNLIATGGYIEAHNRLIMKLNHRDWKNSTN